MGILPGSSLARTADSSEDGKAAPMALPSSPKTPDQALETQAPKGFAQGQFPAQFFLQVQEGMARFDVPDAENLEVLLGYCRKHGYRVEWTGQLPEDPVEMQDMLRSPGGRYIGHRLPEEVLRPEFDLESIRPPTPESAE